MKLIDISHDLSEGMPIYPDDPPVRLEKMRSVEKDDYTLSQLNSGLHAGTHLDAPSHLVRDGKMICDFPLHSFAGRGKLLDVRGQECIEMRPEYSTQVSEGDIVLLFTGCDDKFSSPDYFTRHPVVSRELAEFFISRHIRVLGFDMPSPDYPPYDVHKALLEGEVLLLENLTNLHELLSADGFEVMAFPLKISAEASLVRAVCRLD